MAGPKKRYTKNKGDYVGPYDGSKDTWTTRKITDADGDTRKIMAPAKSKPQEATKYNKGYSDKSAKDAQFFKHTTKGK